jgi:hypothetical protein
MMNTLIWVYGSHTTKEKKKKKKKKKGQLRQRTTPWSSFFNHASGGQWKGKIREEIQGGGSAFG